MAVRVDAAGQHQPSRGVDLGGGPPSVESGRDRYAGFAAALAAAGLQADPDLCVRGPYTVPFGAEAVMRLMGGAAPWPTALYGANHEATLGVLGALVQLGVQVPDQLSLVCHEAAPWLSHWHPPVTVVDSGAHGLGELAAEQILRRVTGRPDTGSEATGRLIRAGSRLVVRRSTAPPGGGRRPERLSRSPPGRAVPRRG